MPPQTLTEFRPASFATSTNCTPPELAVEPEADPAECAPAGDFFGACAASRISDRFHFHSGVASASSKPAPSATSDDPRNLLRGKYIIGPPFSSAPRPLA